MGGETLTVSYSFPWHHFPVMTNVGQNSRPPNPSQTAKERRFFAVLFCGSGWFFRALESLGFLLILGLFVPRRLGPVQIPTPSCAPPPRGSGLKPRVVISILDNKAVLSPRLHVLGARPLKPPKPISSPACGFLSQNPRQLAS